MSRKDNLRVTRGCYFASIF